MVFRDGYFYRRHFSARCSAGPLPLYLFPERARLRCARVFRFPVRDVRLTTLGCFDTACQRGAVVCVCATQDLKTAYAVALYLFSDRYEMTLLDWEMGRSLYAGGLFGEAAFHFHQMLVGYDRLFGRFDSASCILRASRVANLGSGVRRI